MLIARIDGATRVLGKPSGWDDNTVHCAELAIRDEVLDDLPIMISAWTPTPAELARLQAGAHVFLYVWGRNHPPVYMQAGEAPPPISDEPVPEASQ